METVTIATLLASAGDLFDFAMGQVANVATAISGNPLLLLGCVGVPLCGIGVGMFGRLQRSRL